MNRLQAQITSGFLKMILSLAKNPCGVNPSALVIILFLETKPKEAHTAHARAFTSVLRPEQGQTLNEFADANAKPW